MANPSSPFSVAAPSTDQSKTYRVNTGRVAFVPFTANSIEEAVEHVRRHQNPHHAARRWLRVLENGVFAWVS